MLVSYNKTHKMQPALPEKFLVKNNTYSQISFNDLQVGNYYFLEEIVIQFYMQYDYLLQVKAITDNTVEFVKLYTRFNDNLIEPGEWEECEDSLILTHKEIKDGFNTDESQVRFYKCN
jgi:hypothetical protein